MADPGTAGTGGRAVSDGVCGCHSHCSGLVSSPVRLLATGSSWQLGSLFCILATQLSQLLFFCFFASTNALFHSSLPLPEAPCCVTVSARGPTRTVSTYRKRNVPGVHVGCGDPPTPGLFNLNSWFSEYLSILFFLLSSPPASIGVGFSVLPPPVPLSLSSAFGSLAACSQLLGLPMMSA